MRTYASYPQYDGTRLVKEIKDGEGGMRLRVVLSCLSPILAFQVCDLLNEKIFDGVLDEAVWLCWMVDPKWTAPDWAHHSIRERKPIQRQPKAKKEKKPKCESEPLMVTQEKKPA